MWFLLIAAILFVIAMIISAIDCHRFVVRNYNISTHKITGNLRFVLLSDLHGKTYGENNCKLLAAIKELAPDGILIAGDMMTAKPGVPFTNAVNIVKELAKDYPLFYGIGNHEYRTKLYPEVYGDMGERYEKALSECQVYPIDNKRIHSEMGIDICGLSIDREYYRRFKKIPMEMSYIDSLVGESEESRFQILLAHNPQYGDTYMDWGADLTVSGHVHGGLIRLPLFGGVASPNFRFFPKFDGGLYEKNGKCMIVSRGLGTHSFPLRIFNPGELIVIDMQGN